MSADLFSEPNDPAYYALPSHCRQEVRLWLRILRQIASAPNVRGACRRLANTSFKGVRGFSESRIVAVHYTFKRAAADWRVLVDWAKAGPAARGDTDAALPRDFISFWKKLCEDNQRNGGMRTAHRELKHIYRTGYSSARSGPHAREYKTIPGYENCASGFPSPSGRGVRGEGQTGSFPPPDPLTGLPPGWTYQNLTRYAPDNFERKAARIGKTAAADHRRQVILTRVGLRFGQYILFDDQEYDLKVNYLSAAGHAAKRAMRPLGFNALELLSACSFAYAFKPTLWNPETEAREKLKEIDAVWFALHGLTSHGYRTDDVGTRLVVERGTMALRERFEQRIFDATRGHVRVDRGGIDSSPAFAGLFESPSRGNFRFKAALESFFNLVRNEMAFLPGATGKDRHHSPEQLHGADRYNEQMLRLAAALPEDRAALLKLPFLEWTQFVSVAMDIYRLINARTDHNLEGWRQLGFVANEWRLPLSAPSVTSCSTWLPVSQFQDLPDPIRAAMQSMFDRDPSLTRSRQMSPAEVFARHAGELTPLPEFMLLDILGDDAGHHATERTVRDGYITFQDHTIDPGELRFIAAFDSGPHASGRSLRNGDKFNTLLNPFNPTRLHLYNATNGYVGTLPRDFAPVRSDYAAVKRKMGEARHDEAQRLHALGLRHLDKARDKTDMHTHNARVASGAPITPEELARAQAREDAIHFARSEQQHRADDDADRSAPAEIVDLT